MFTNILVPFDGRDGSLHALQTARQIAERFNAELIVLTVVNASTASGWSLPKSASEALEADDIYLHQGEAIQQSAKSILTTFQRPVTYSIRKGAPVECILDEVTLRACDAIVMGHRGLTSMEKLLLGSVSDEIVQQCAVPIVIVK